MLLAKRLAVVVLLTGALLGALEREPWETYRSRRAQLAKRHPGGVILLFGYNDREAHWTRSAFRQENNFYYLTGWNEPGAVLLLTPPPNETSNRGEILFLPARDGGRERWSGPRVGPSDPDLPSKTGFSAVRDVADLEDAVSKALESHEHLCTLLPHAPSYGQRPPPDRRPLIARLAPGVEPRDVRPSLSRMRMRKSEGEIRLIQKAVDASVAAHRAAWGKIRPGIFEYQIMATMLATMAERGCLRAAYPPIIGSGFNSTVLHYTAVSARLEPDELVLMDVGGEYAHYACDLTRTVPVNGSFSQRQGALYAIVLQAQKAAIEAVRPGMTLAGSVQQSLAQIARDVLDAEGKKRLGKPLGNRMIHGVGHHVGLEVHDPGDPHAGLEPGMVITIEPGVYLPEENLGIRIEDMVLVTEQGSRVLSADLPREPAEIERVMRREIGSQGGQ